MSWLRSRSIRIATLPAMLATSSCSQILDPAGPIGRQEKLILINSVAIMLCIVIPTLLVTLGFAWWYREGNSKAVYKPDFAYSGRIEAVVWAIPVLVILFLGGITWIGSHDLDPGKPIESKVRPIDVQVVSLDWKWLFIYPGQGVATVNRVVVPAGVPVHFHITSATVMNAFFVPRLGSMIYAMNGMETRLFLQSDQPGRYMGLSSHFSGDGFSDMKFDVQALPPAQFAAWAAGTRGKGPQLDRAGYDALARESKAVTPYSYGAVMPGLFDAIVLQTIPPAAGPNIPAQGGVNVSPRTES